MSLPTTARRTLRVVRDLVLDALDATLGRRVALSPPRRLRFIGDGDFATIGNEFAEHLCNLAGLAPDHRILDVGCGVGRIAIPLLDYVSAHGAYEGFDIVPRAIRYCTRYVTARNPRFRFTLVDLRNRAYRPKSGSSAATFHFPYPDSAFDVVVATSVFTHLLPDEAENYLEQIARVLKPGGRCLITWFLRNDESERLLRNGRSTIPLHHAYGPYLVLDPMVPEAAIAYPQDIVKSSYDRAGLHLVDFHPGAWCGRERFVSGQDIVVATKVCPTATLVGL